jgi:hypothetical protein
MRHPASLALFEDLCLGEPMRVQRFTPPPASTPNRRERPIAPAWSDMGGEVHKRWHVSDHQRAA